MKLRRRIVITAAALLLGVGLLATGLVVWLLRTESGFTWVHARLEGALRSKVNGKIHIGRLHGSSLTSPTIDTIEIRDMDDSVIFASGPISFSFDLLDLWEKRIALHDVIIHRAFFHLRRLPSGDWNYKPMIRRDTGLVIPRVPGAGRKLGDVIVLDSVEVRGGEFRWTDMWSPPRWLARAARDSAIRYNLARKDVEVRRIGSRLVKIRHWDSLRIMASQIRIKDPARPGFGIDFSRLDAVESDPPFNLKNAHGSVSHLRDTVRVKIDGFSLPGSRGSAEGVLTTKGGLGVNVRVVGDTVSMNDIAWLYPTMPADGGGTMVLDIRKDSSSDHIAYALSKMDVRTVESRLRGAMTFGVGEAILALTDVDLELAPVNFKLIEQFSGGPLSLPWAGDLSGHVKARGGPLTQFFIDSASITFADANVPGVVNRFSGRGLVDINRPLYTTFYDFSADIQHFDLRTTRALDSLFPPLEGWVYGTARLDSIWTDLRLRNADFYYAADSASVSHFTGGGRVIVGETEMSYDLALNADPINLGSFALSYEKFPLKGMYSGPFTVRGSIGALELTGDLTGEGGRVHTEGLTYDGLEPGLGVTGTLDLSTINLARVLINPPAWNGTISAALDMALTGDSIANLEGRMRVRLAPSTIADVQARGGYGSFTFGDGLMRVDSLTATSDAFALQGKGALGLRRDRRDTLLLTTQIDSLGGLRRFIAPVVDTLPVDSLKGKFTATARLFGSLDSLGLRGTANGTDVVYGMTTAAALDAGIDLDDLTGRRAGTISLSTRTMQALGIRFTGMRAEARMAGDSARVTAKATSETGPEIDAGANVTWDSLAVNTVLDSLQIVLDDRRWRLTRPARIVQSADLLTVDTLELRSGDSTRLIASARVPSTGEIAGMLRAEAFPLSDLGRLFQVTVPISGVSALDARISGTREAPLMTFEVRALNAGVGETRVEGLRINGDYRDRALTASLEYSSGGTIVMRGEGMLPIDLALRPVARRILDTPLRASLDADTTDLAILKTFWSGIQDASGELDMRLRAAGTWKNPILNGTFAVHKGRVFVTQLGLPYNDVTASIRFTGDSIVVDSITARSGGNLKLFGNITQVGSENPAFDLRLRTNAFHAIANTAIADLTITTDPNLGVKLCCQYSASSLSGAILADGSIYIPDTYTKNLIQIDPAYLSAVDTSIFRNRRLLPPTPPKIVANMRVEEFTLTAGDNLTLKSAEANIGLTGSLKLNVTPRARGGQLDLLGTLYATGGTYRLNLGPLQRTFAVDTGYINFFGDPERAAELDIRTTYTIRQYDQRDARQDIQVNATVTGTLFAPTISLSSPDARLNDADLISYITWGSPSLEIGGRGSSYANTLTAGLITSAGSALSSRFGGGNCNVNTANISGVYNSSLGQAAGNILAGTRFGCSKQLNDQTFVRLDAGICSLNQQISDFANSVGLKLEYRFGGGLTGSAGIDPPTSAVVCTQTNNARGFVPTPRQFGLDIFKSWRW